MRCKMFLVRKGRVLGPTPEVYLHTERDAMALDDRNTAPPASGAKAPEGSEIKRGNMSIALPLELVKSMELGAEYWVDVTPVE